MSAPDPRMRAGNADRQQVVDQLAQHMAEGRLTTTEFDERTGIAYAATYLDELAPLLADLPVEAPRQAAPRPVRVRSAPRGVRPWVIVLAIVVMFASIGAMARGMPPFPLLWIGIALLFMSRRRGACGRPGPPRFR